MKIGLITIYQVSNYGSVLQAYATQVILEKLGHDCYMINYEYPNEWHFQRGIFVRPNPIMRFVRKLGLTVKHRKNNNLQTFRKDHFNFTTSFKDFDALKSYNWDDYDAFVAGSDQIWNARFLKGDPTFLLAFAPDNKTRISLAASFALKELPVEYLKLYKQELSKFKYLSVRENNGIDIIHKQLGIDKDVFTCLDPTLLLSAKEWQDVVPRSGLKKKRRYILFYMWAYAFEPRPYIFEVLKYFKEKMADCEIIALEGYTPPKQALGVRMCDASDSSIPDFIDLFSNADLVITSSFHGTAFALNFGRPLISIVPDNDGDDRQSFLLKSLHADMSIVKINTPLSQINPFGSSNDVEEILQAKRLSCIEAIAAEFTK